ncbi:MAG: HAD family hydrolase [Balneolaceae bacterium]|nr:HAD family hydrolase [Balneolaceae bacterium]MCH8549618.1 HAD family hydrolase [Balneolaceae bacterium]
MSQVNREFTDLHERFKELSSPMEPQPTGTEPKLQDLEGIKAVLFDFYGTLFLSGVGDIGIDDGKSDAGLMREALTGAGISIKDPKAGKQSLKYYQDVVDVEMDKLRKAGMDTPEPDIRKIWGNVLNLLEKEGLIEGPVSDELQDRISVEFEARMNPVWPVPGAVGTLKTFKERGFQMGIISNSQFYTPIVLEALSGANMETLGFDPSLLHWSFEERMKKPDTRFYELFLEKAANVDKDLKPENMLYAGNDMLKDIWPANKLGMKTALFAGDKRSLKWRKDDERCAGLEPDIIFTEFIQLEDILIIPAL